MPDPQMKSGLPEIMDGVSFAVSQFENEELTALWKSLIEQEDHHE